MKNTPKFYKRMFKNLHGNEDGRASMPVKSKIPTHLLKILFLRTLPESQFSVLGP